MQQNLPQSLDQSHGSALMAVLHNAMSPDDNLRKPATATLKQFEQIPGFISLLLLISSPSQNIPVPINQFAAIQLKNVIGRNWRRGNIQENERISIKQNLLQRLNETNSQVAEQLLVIVSKIAREDVPEKWPNLFDILTQQLSFPHAPFVMRTLNKVLKTLSSKRTASDRRVFAELANKMLPSLVEHWKQRKDQLFQSLQQAGYNSNGLSQTSISNEVRHRLQAEATCVMYCLKSVCRLVVYGKTPLDAGTITNSFLSEMFTSLRSMLETVLDTSIIEGQRRMAANESPFDGEGDADKEEKKSLEGRLRSMVEVSLKTVGRVRSNQPTAFGPYLEPFLQLTYSIVVDRDCRVAQHGDAAKRYETPSLLACQFLSKCLTERDYEGRNNPLGLIVETFIFGSSGSGSNGSNGSNNTNAKGVIAAPKSETKSNVLIRILASRFMSLTTPDLTRWEEDPEEYVLSQESVAVDSSLRPTAQDLYLALVEYDERSAPKLFVTMMRNTEAEFDTKIREGRTSEIELVELAKVLDGMWTGAGIDTTLLKRELDYSDWFMRRLVPVIQSTVHQSQQQQLQQQQQQQQQQQFSQQTLTSIQTSPHQKILQYRALWLIGCLTYELPDDVHGPIYNALMELLTVNDVVVCVATITALRSMIDNVGFGRDSFTKQPGCAKGFIARLYWVLNQNAISSFDTRAAILDIVSKLITQYSGNGLPGTVDEIVGPLPQLWTASEDQNLLRTSILTILTEIVNAVGTSVDSERVHAQVFPLVLYATDTSQPESIYLADEGLKLWQSILSHTTTYTPQLHTLFSNVISMMIRDFDHTTECMALLESYLCTGGVTFIQAYSSALRDMFVRTVGQVRKDASLKLTKAMGRMLKMYPREMPSLLMPVFSEMLKSIVMSYNDGVRIKQIQTSNNGGQNVAPNRDLDHPLVIVSYLSILALLLMQSADLFNTFLSSDDTTRNTNCSTDQLWSLLVDQWIVRFDDIGGGSSAPWVRKSWVMALCVPLSTGDSVAMSRFIEIVNLCVHSLADDTTNASIFVPSPNKDNNTSSNQNGGGRISLDATAKNTLQASDPVYCTPLKTTVQNALQSCQATLGSSFQQLISATDQTMMTQLQTFLN